MVCNSCGRNLNEDAVVCPSCEAIIIDPSGLKRKEDNRPSSEDKTQIISRNFNGIHIVKQLSDGSFVCTCPSFLLQRGTQNTATPFMTCKHIREFLSNNAAPEYRGKEPSDWQKFLLRTLGTGTDHLSNAQAYYLISELLQLRGISYPELTWFLKRQKKPSLIPLVNFGVEIEGGIRNKNVFQRQLTDAGITAALTDYTGHSVAANEWRISFDGSVSGGEGFMPMELVTPKLMGNRGLEQLKKVVGIWNDIGANHNSSAGVHVHLYIYGAENDMEFCRRLAYNFARIERQYLWYLISPSRRNNGFCKALNEAFFMDEENNLRGNGNRYYALNFNALKRHKTVEVRLLNCTTAPAKICSWVVLLACFYEATRNGLTFDRIPDNDFGQFLNVIGLNDSACSILKQVKSHLLERYKYWKKDAIKHPEHIPRIPPLDIARVSLLPAINTLRNEIYHLEEQLPGERLGGSRQRPQCAPEALWNLGRGNTQRNVDLSTIIKRDNPDGTICLIVDGRLVTYNQAEDSLTCTCSYGRHNQNRCYHGRWAARYLLKEIFAERLAEARRELAQLTGEGTQTQQPPEEAVAEPLTPEQEQSLEAQAEESQEVMACAG